MKPNISKIILILISISILVIKYDFSPFEIWGFIATLFAGVAFGIDRITRKG